MYGVYFDSLQYPSFSQCPQPSFSSLHSIFSSELESPKVELKKSYNLVLTFSETAGVFEVSEKYHKLVNIRKPLVFPNFSGSTGRDHLHKIA